MNAATYRWHGSYLEGRFVLAFLLLTCACHMGTSGCRRDNDQAIREGSSYAFGKVLIEALNDGDRRAAERLARSAEESFPDPPPRLAGLIMWAYWRAGKLEDAERVAEMIPEDTDDQLSLLMLSRIHLSRGERERAGELADRMVDVGCEMTWHWLQVAQVRLACGQTTSASEAFANAAEVLPAESKDLDRSEEMLARELKRLKGRARFYGAIGGEPLNQIEQYGQAALFDTGASDTVSACYVTINGHGPYRLVIDSGAGNELRIAQHVAEEADVQPLAQTVVFDALQAGQTASLGLAERLSIGKAEIHRVPVP